jgi:hypothetical protein
MTDSFQPIWCELIAACFSMIHKSRFFIVGFCELDIADAWVFLHIFFASLILQ